MAILSQDMAVPVAPQARPSVGPDLLSVTYQPSSWHTRVLFPICKKALLAAAVLAIGGAGWWSYRLHQQHLAGQSALAHLTQCRLFSTRSDLAGANREAQLALEQASLSGDRAILAQTQLTLGDLSASQNLWDEAVAQYQSALELGSSQTQLSQKLTAARQRMDKEGRAQALDSLRQARQQMGKRDYVPALKSTAEAQRLLQIYHGSQHQLAESQYVNGLVLDKMGLTGECLDHLRLALQADPHHRQASTLLARLTTPPSTPRPASSPYSVAQPAAAVEVLSPRIETGASYPTYQRPSSPDEELDRSTEGEEVSRPTNSAAGYPTYQPRRKKEER